MKIKTSELTGIALDWAVAKCEEHNIRGFVTLCCGKVSIDTGYDYLPYSPSSDWSQGGPIIEREGIDNYQLSQGLWESSPSFGMSDEFLQYGPTPLIAAMRCYVASKLGAEVDVPEELSL